MRAFVVVIVIVISAAVGCRRNDVFEFSVHFGAFLAQLLRNHKMFDFRLSVVGQLGNWHYDDDQVIFGGNFIGPSNA